MKYKEERKKRKLEVNINLSDEATMILGTIGGTGAFIGLLVGAVACSQENEKNKYFQYSVNESGEYIADGTIKFEDFKQCYFVEIENPSCNSQEFYICRKPSKDSNKYINLLNNEEIFEGKTFENQKDKNSERNIVNEAIIEQYLYGFEQVKAEYTSDDVREILEQIKKSFSEKEDKVLVKSTFNKYFTKVNL